MKKINLSQVYKFFLVFLFSCMQVLVWAQDQQQSSSSQSSSTTTKTTSETVWYTQPWVWIAGGAVFIIILIALLRGNSSTSNTESRTTVIKDRV
jgi:hypothetical protein